MCETIEFSSREATKTGVSTRFSLDTKYGAPVPPRLPFDRVAPTYDDTRGLAPKALSRVLGVLVGQLEGKHVLEVGVGTGRIAVPLQKSGVRVVGVEISRKMVELGLAKGLRDVLFSDGARLPFTDGAFDVAMTVHVLHLVPDWPDVLLEIARVTRESYATILEKGDPWPIGREYHEGVREGGYIWAAPGLHERDLPSRLAPDLVMPVGPFDETTTGDAVLAELERREYSSQWEVPEPLHQAVMGRLRERWSGQELSRTYTMDIAFWRISRIAEFALRSGS